jgi:hypothetical protein
MLTLELIEAAHRLGKDPQLPPRTING